VEKKRKKKKKRKKGKKKIHDNEKIDLYQKDDFATCQKCQVARSTNVATCPHPSNSPMAPTRLAQRGKDFTMLPLGVKRLH
jgi:hypothetical protein